MLSDSRTTPAILARDLTKVYRLYQRPAYRLLDLLGLCPDDAQHFSRHAALSDVNIEIERGQKVAIIGRNGAGKSTLLKLIAGVIRPTSGSIVVHGRISNLLQLGTGFHPEFTGRQNVYASLAHQGIAGREADRAFDDVLAFAEIEEYIDQPMKTYSTGMCSRLMFSSTVVLNPEILIVDEILGVGDAYFSHKSFEKMRALTSQQHTTLLLVTHDIYSAMNLCDRFVWIDFGRIKFDGEARTAVAMYEASIKEQEERALRQRTAAGVSEKADVETTRPMHVLIRSRTGFALPKPLAIESISLVGVDGAASTLIAADASTDWHLLPEGSVGREEIVDGRRCRVLQTHGSIYHKAEWVIALPSAFTPIAAGVSWNYTGAEPAELAVFSHARHVLVRGELSAGSGWQARTFQATTAGREELSTPAQTEYGTGTVRIVGVQMLDAAGQETTRVKHGDPLTLRVHLHMHGERLAPRQITFVLGITRQNTPYAVNVVNHHLDLPATGDDCVLDVRLATVELGSGTWYVRVGVAEAGLFERPTIKYFAVDAGWHHLMREGIPLEVLSIGHLDAAGCFMVHPATFTVHQIEPSSVAKDQAAAVADE